MSEILALDSEIKPMILDKRPVEAIFNREATYRVGDLEITSIVVYQEYGHMAMINYAAIYKGDFLWMRIDLSGWGVSYEQEAENE